ncbi:MAG: c-type cytochrome [Opitutae bacterium]|nr:c-type cytochrome [Opitutae bacterium]MBC9888659.1 c-type cytochrome [Opitutae bacterium]
MSDDIRNRARKDLITDADLASFSRGKSPSPARFTVYLAMIIIPIISGLYLGRYSGGFDSQQYWEKNEIAEQIAALGGGLADGSEESAEVLFDPVKEGMKIYQTICMACHQVNGQGLPGAFPPLAQSSWVEKNPAMLARIVLHGLYGPITVNDSEYNSVMAPLGAVLSDEQIALVLTYVRQEWGNAAAAVEADEVAQARSESSGRAAMWTVEELAPWDTD